MDNKTLGLDYYADKNDAPVSDLLRHSSIKNEKKIMVLSDSSWQDFPDTGRVYFIKVGQLTTAHMFQEYLLNHVHKVSTMQHVLQEWI